MQLRPIEHQKQRILTTQQIAEFYETTPRRVSENYNANKARYIEGKHYFCLEGETLEAFKTTFEIQDSLEETTSQFAGKSAETTTEFPYSLKGVNKLYLWTEKGALMHAKSLNTDKAWERYEELVDDYYRRGDQIQNLQAILAHADETITHLFTLRASHLDLTQISWECGRWHESYDQLQSLISKQRQLSPVQKQGLTTLLKSIDARVKQIEVGQTEALSNYRETQRLLVGYLNAKQKTLG
jgi:hypothetical protein